MKYGLLMVAYGELYLAEAIKSSESYRRHMPDLPIALVTPDPTQVPEAVFDQVIELSVECPSEIAPYGPGFYYKIQGLRQSPFDFTLFVDTDTWCLAPVYHLFARLKGFDILLWPDQWQPKGDYGLKSLSDLETIKAHTTLYHYSSGIIGYTKKCYPFFKEWGDHYLANAPKQAPRYGDQLSLGQTLWNSNLRIYTLPEEDHTVGNHPVGLNGKVKILHSHNLDHLEKKGKDMNCSTQKRMYLPTIGTLEVTDMGGKRIYKPYYHCLPEQDSGLYLRKEIVAWFNSLKNFRQVDFGRPKRFVELNAVVLNELWNQPNTGVICDNELMEYLEYSGLKHKYKVGFTSLGKINGRPAVYNQPVLQVIGLTQESSKDLLDKLNSTLRKKVDMVDRIWFLKAD